MSYSTVEDLLAKKPKTLDVKIGDLKVKISAMGAKAYDDLLGAHPPTPKQKKDGATFNVDTMAPVLLSECLLDPVLTVEQADELYRSNAWSAGEMGSLYLQCMRLCTEGLNLPTTADD